MYFLVTHRRPPLEVALDLACGLTGGFSFPLPAVIAGNTTTTVWHRVSDVAQHRNFSAMLQLLL